MDVFFFFHMCTSEKFSWSHTAAVPNFNKVTRKQSHFQLVLLIHISSTQKTNSNQTKSKSLYASISSWDQASDAEKNSPLPRRDQLCLRRQREAYVDPLWFCLKTDVD